MASTTQFRNVSKGFLDTSLGKLYYWTVGQGTPLLCIHQSSSSSEEYASLIPLLSDRYQLISFDWIGHGNSDDPDHEPSVEEYTDCAEAILDHLSMKSFSAIGHHGGALIAMNLAYRQPDRVKALILSGTSGPKTEKEAQQFKATLKSKKKKPLERSGEALFDAWKRYADYMPYAEAMEMIPPYINSLNQKIKPYDAHGSMLQWDRTQALNSLRCPVLLMQGTFDVFVSKQDKLMEIIPNCERVELSNSGPFGFFDDGENCARTIDNFLTNRLVK